MEFLIYSAKSAEILYSNSTSLKASSLVLIPSLMLMGDYLYPLLQVPGQSSPNFL